MYKVKCFYQVQAATDWKYITDQIGMFACTGMMPKYVATCTRDYSSYLTKDGRISITCITSADVGHLAEAMQQPRQFSVLSSN